MRKHRGSKRQKWKPDKAVREGLRQTIATWEHMNDDAVHTWFMLNGATACCAHKHHDFRAREEVGVKLKKIFQSREKFIKELGFVRPPQVCLAAADVDTPTHGVRSAADVDTRTHA